MLELDELDEEIGLGVYVLEEELEMMVLDDELELSSSSSTKGGVVELDDV